MLYRCRVRLRDTRGRGTQLVAMSYFSMMTFGGGSVERGLSDMSVSILELVQLAPTTIRLTNGAHLKMYSAFRRILSLQISM